MNSSYYEIFRCIFKYATPKRKLELLALLMLMMLVSISEVVNIGSVLPFLGVLIDPERVYKLQLMQPLITFLNIGSSRELLLPLSLGFGGLVFITAFLRLYFLWFSHKFSYEMGADLSTIIYRKTLYQPYAEHISRNSSEIISGISNKCNALIAFISSIITLCGSLLMLLAVFAAMVFIEPTIAIAAFFGFTVIYLFINFLTKERLRSDSQKISRNSTLVIKALQEGLGGIRDILLDGSQEIFVQIHSNADLNLRKAQGRANFLAIFPRYGVEALGMVLIIFLAYQLSISDDGVLKAIPILGALALGAQRCLPSFQQLYSAWSGILGSKASIIEALLLLEQPLPAYLMTKNLKALDFNRDIVLRGISFKYDSNLPEILAGIDITITKGSYVGILGRSGEGKSTLLDIIMGLLAPTNGVMEVDGIPICNKNRRQWQANIAHVPQSIFLADSSIEENIAFGVPVGLIDPVKVKWAAQLAQIDQLIEHLPNAYKTEVGERGIRLSGGQRQRVGIARAIYKNAKIIIFDEATSSLDEQTEDDILKVIERLSAELTIIVVAHRMSTLKKCSRLIQLSKGKALEVDWGQVSH